MDCFPYQCRESRMGIQLLIQIMSLSGKSVPETRGRLTSDESSFVTVFEKKMGLEISNLWKEATLFALLGGSDRFTGQRKAKTTFSSKGVCAQALLPSGAQRGGSFSAWLPLVGEVFANPRKKSFRYIRTSESLSSLNPGSFLGKFSLMSPHRSAGWNRNAEGNFVRGWRWNCEMNRHFDVGSAEIRLSTNSLNALLLSATMELPTIKELLGDLRHVFALNSDRRPRSPIAFPGQRITHYTRVRSPPGGLFQP